MSDWRGHLKFGISLELIGIILWIFLAVLKYVETNYYELLFVLFFMVLAPLFPDLDHRSSIITNYSILALVILLWYFYLFNMIYLIYVLTTLTVIVSVAQFATHRGITHNYWFWIVMGIFFMLYTNMFFAGSMLIVGTFSHIWLDNS